MERAFRWIRLALAPLLSAGLAACQQGAGDGPPAPTAAFEETAYALTVEGTTLTVLGGPDDGRQFAVAGLNDGSILLGLDHRPSDGLLYALGNDGQLYTLSFTGVATPVGPAHDYGDLSEGVAFDVNPQLDALRVIATADGRNFVADPDTGVATEYTRSAYGPGGGQGEVPNVLATAYTNPVSPFPPEAVTTQYSLEATRDTYAVQAKNEGTLTTIGVLDVDFGGPAGLDISGATGTAYALLNVGGTQGLYTISAGDATLTRLDIDVAGLADLTIVPARVGGPDQ